MTTPNKKLLALTRDVGLRLGAETTITAQTATDTEETEYALVFPRLTLDQVKHLVDWLDYYVPTAEEQESRERVPFGGEPTAGKLS